MQEIDIEMVKRAQNGDRAAFDSIITVYRQMIAGLCFKYMRNQEEALDMAQEVFCAAYTNIKSFQYKSKFSTWLYRVAVNLCINRLGALKSRHYYDTGSISGDEKEEKPAIEIRDKRPDAADELEAVEANRMIMEALEDFDADSKNVIILREMQELEYEEISTMLNMPVGSVKSKLSRAREKLREKLIRKTGGAL
jgi:RNA polymerase sigma-70 factor (ECF subfamily)